MPRLRQGTGAVGRVARAAAPRSSAGRPGGVLECERNPGPGRLKQVRVGRKSLFPKPLAPGGGGVVCAPAQCNLFPAPPTPLPPGARGFGNRLLVYSLPFGSSSAEEHESNQHKDR